MSASAAAGTARLPIGIAVAVATWSAAATIAAPALRLLLLARRRAGREIGARVGERRGAGAGVRPDGRLLWVHAASLGELSAVLPVLDVLLSGETGPAPALLLTTATVSGADLASRWIAAGARADAVRHRMVPFDVPRWIGRFLDRWRPDAAVFLESEIWPNTIRLCRARRIPLVLLNARLSARSARRWNAAPALARHLLGAFDPVWARSDEDRDRLRRFGVHPGRVGDLKASAPPLPFDEAARAELSARLAGRPRLLAASTHEGEETLLARVHARLAPRHPGLVTIIAPRHPARGAALAESFGGAPRRALGAPPPADGGIWIADTFGELGLLYRLAPVVFLGRSFGGDGGGQNPWEPARLGCAVVVGPSTRNFREPVSRLLARGGLVAVGDEEALTAALDGLLADAARADAIGNAARAVAAEAASSLVHDAARMIASLGVPASRPAGSPP